MIESRSWPAASAGSLGAAVAAARRLLDRHRLLRFLVTGVANTAFSYAVFCLALLALPTFASLVVSTALGILFNFVSIGSYVFRAGTHRLTTFDPWRFARFVVVYGAVFLYGAGGLALLERAGVRPQLGALLLLPGTVLISYGLNRLFVFIEPQA